MVGARSHEDARRNSEIRTAARTANVSIIGAALMSVARNATACWTAGNSGIPMLALWTGRESSSTVTREHLDWHIKGRRMYAQRDNPSTNI